jgi:GT2 family glycosyltransferase
MSRRALVSQPRVPEPDRDRGSQRVDQLIDLLLDDGWTVTFIAEEEAIGWPATRLRQKGVATFAGYGHASEVISNGSFDLALLAFWEPASRLLPLLRQLSPATRVMVDTIDLHFLRVARRHFGAEGRLDEAFGAELVGELNVYRAADAVLAVSEKETSLLRDLLATDRVHHLPLVEERHRSPVPLEERHGLLFIGNFRHLPNGEAVEFLCRDVLPRLDAGQLAEHPLTVIGNRLDDTVRAHGAGLPGVKMVGWVPTIEPYLERARVCVVPLLHGAGVKGKVIQALMTGTPVVTTPIGAEGLDLVAGEHALIAEDPADVAAAIDRLLWDDETWWQIADAGYEHVRRGHDPALGCRRFREIVNSTLTRVPVVDESDGNFKHTRRRAEAYRETRAALQSAVEQCTDPGSVVAVVAKGDDDLIRFTGRAGWHFPRSHDGRWAGYHPADSEAALHALDEVIELGATHLALPETAFWWLHHYPGLAGHLERHSRRAHEDEHVIVYELTRPDPVDDRPIDDDGRTTSDAVHRETVLVKGTYRSDRSGPPPRLVRALDTSQRFRVIQRWRRASDRGAHDESERLEGEGEPSPAWIVEVDDAAVVDTGFLDELLSHQERLGADRAQPAHHQGPAAGSPLSERLAGCAARLIGEPLPLPVFSRRAEAERVGPTWLIDTVTTGSARPIRRDPQVEEQRVLDVALLDEHAGPHASTASGLARSRMAPRHPALSVLIATFDRPELLAECLTAFGTQVGEHDFEIVVVDDGSPGTETTRVIEHAAGTLPLVHVCLAHAGRSAAKNLAVQVARAELVVFFDDDDRPAPDFVDQHLAAHDANPALGTAVLGHTGWAPELAVSPLMHYLTDVDRMLFAYGNLRDDQELDWRGFWEGRISCKRALLMRHGLHDQRLDYSIDVEMAWRLSVHDLRVVYRASARSHMARPISFDDFCRRIEAKGRAQALIAQLHDDPAVRAYARVDQARSCWETARAGLDDACERTRSLEATLAERIDEIDPNDPRLAELYTGYRGVFQALYAKGVCEVTDGPSAPARPAANDGQIATDNEVVDLTVVIPVWSRTPELADMAVRTIDRIWDVAKVRTEVIAIDNGSPHRRTLRARVHRFGQNNGVATAWNTGIAMACAPVVAILNSDCLVEPGWDEALLDAATAGRRIAFPYTDHGDGQGFRLSDQAGTAGWCFALHVDLFTEIGPFDERFNPAYGEDTDYWHRAWELGVELSPVPAARVTHVRRTTASTDPHYEWLLQAHRYKYGWKHGVDPLRAPPYYNRPIVEFVSDHAGLR